MYFYVICINFFLFKTLLWYFWWWMGGVCNARAPRCNSESCNDVVIATLFQMETLGPLSPIKEKAFQTFTTHHFHQNMKKKKS